MKHLLNACSWRACDDDDQRQFIFSFYFWIYTTYMYSTTIWWIGPTVQIEINLVSRCASARDTGARAQSAIGRIINNNNNITWTRASTATTWIARLTESFHTTIFIFVSYSSNSILLFFSYFFFFIFFPPLFFFGPKQLHLITDECSMGIDL